MLTGSSLLLLTLILHVQLCSPAPITAKVAQDPAPEDAPEKHAEKEAAPEEPLLIVPDDNSEVEEKPFPLTPEGEKSVLVPAELETEEEGQGEPAAGETAPEELLPEEPPEQELDQDEQGETVLSILSETKEEETPEEWTKEEEVLEEKDEVNPATNKEPLPSTLEEEEYDALFPVELEGQVETGESDTEDPVVIVPLDPAEEEPEPEEEVEEEPITIVSPEEPDEEDPEEYTEVEVAEVPDAVSEDNAQRDLTITEEPLPSTPEEKESVVLAGLDIEEEGQEETGPEKPAVIVHTTEESAPEDPALIAPLDDLKEDAPENNTEEETVQSDALPEEEDTAPQENKAGDSDAETLVMSITETTSETTEEVLDPGEDIPAAATEVQVATLKPATAPELAAADTETKTIVEDDNGTSMKTHGEDFKAAVTLTEEEEPVALVNRGALLSAAFFTLMSFITIGFVWTTISKKLH